MRRKVGLGWSDNEPRTISDTEVSWAGGFQFLMFGEHHTKQSVPDASGRYEPDHDNQPHGPSAEPAWKGVE